MCRLLETIKIKDRRVFALDRHNDRANRSRRALFGSRDSLDLGLSLDAAQIIPPGGLVRCRVLFAEQVERVEYHPYRLPVISSLLIVHADDIDYRYKFEDRRALSELFSRRGAADEILIVRDGLVTDTSISNVVCFDGERYVTPARPLLDGTKRAALLESGAVSPADISIDDLGKYMKVLLVNSLIDLEDDVSVPVSAIRA
jgi:4-amino-4-deoxychorismate lyase